MPLSFVQPDAPVLNCPIAVYERHDGPSAGPQVRAYRDGAPADVAFQITKSENVQLDVDQKTLDCKGNVISEQVVTLPYRRYELALYGLELGDKLTIDDVQLAPVLGGACPVLGPVVAVESEAPGCGSPAPSGSPSAGADWSDSDATTDENLSPYGDDMNCNAGGRSSLLVGLAIVALVYGRRRRAS